MAIEFPSKKWLLALIDVLNDDQRYADVAKNWEGDILVVIDPDDTVKSLKKTVAYYLDLWHGHCRGGNYYDELSGDLPEPSFTFRTEMGNILKLFSGELDPMQAMLTRRLRVDGSMAYLLRNIPTVLDFIRCCRKVPLNIG
jgi:putative sterol carrier protein